MSFDSRSETVGFPTDEQVRDLVSRLKAPKGKFRAMAFDTYSQRGECWALKDFDSLEKAKAFVAKKQSNKNKFVSFRVFDDAGNALN